jgi:hypothetical protein
MPKAADVPIRVYPCPEPAAARRPATAATESPAPGAAPDTAAPTRRDLCERAIAFLRGEENPFDWFVVADKPGLDFDRCHVQDIHRPVYEILRLAIDKYRRPDYRRQGHLHPTRVLFVRGARGSGKTHLLHWMGQYDSGEHDSDTPELWVRPRFYDGGYPFAEYLLRELLRVLLCDDEPQGPPLLSWCTQEVGRRLLLESVAALALGEWLEWVGPPSRCRVLLGRARGKGWPNRERLVRDLRAGGNATLLEICQRNHIDPDVAHRLIAAHIAACERGSGVQARMRREVLGAFAQRALGRTADSIATLLEQDFAEDHAGLPPTRAALVDALLQTLVELLAAIGVPVVFAFDNLERLLAPRGALDEPTAQAFWTGLAHVGDQIQGVLVLLLIETQLWLDCMQRAVNSFAQDRLLQGIRLREHGCVCRLDLQPPTVDDVAEVVRRRLAPLLDRVPNGAQLPETFPFSRDDLEAVVGHGSDIVRTVLMRLRERYDALVLPAGQAPQPAVRSAIAEAPGDVAAQSQFERQVLMPSWDRAVAAKRENLQTLLRPALAKEFHEALGRWLELLDGAVAADWKLAGVDPPTLFGDQPAFGLVTVVHWDHAARGRRRVALGPLLGAGSSMPKDLRVKLGLFELRPVPADELVILWPRRRDDQALLQTAPRPAPVDELPPATRKVWEESAAARPVVLCPVAAADFAWLLGIPDWLADIASSEGAAWTEDLLRRFLLTRSGALLEQLTPQSHPKTDREDQP